MGLTKNFVMFLAFCLLVGNLLSLIIDGLWIQPEDINIMKSLTGMNGLQTASWTSIFTVPIHFITQGFPKLILWDYSFLQGQLAIIRWFLFIISVGAIWALASMFLQAIQSIFAGKAV